RATEGRERPASQIHRRRGLPDAQHMMETFWITQILNEQWRARKQRAHRNIARQLRDIFMLTLPKMLGHLPDQVSAARKTAKKEIAGDFPFPDGRLEEGNVVILWLVIRATSERRLFTLPLRQSACPSHQIRRYTRHEILRGNLNRLIVADSSQKPVQTALLAPNRSAS